MSEITEGDRVEHYFDNRGRRTGTVKEINISGLAMVEWDDPEDEDDEVWSMNLDALRREHDGFNVVDEVIPQEWVDYDSEAFGEYIHLVPDRENRELRCYRSVKKPEETENKRIKTTIPDVEFGFIFDDELGVLNYFYLTDSKARTFMSLLDLIGRGRKGPINFEWWEESGMPMMEDKKTGIETIHFDFTRPDGVERRVTISNAWQSPKAHKLAKIEGDEL